MKDVIEIENIICDFFEISREDLYSSSLKQKHANARHYLWLVLHYNCGMSNLAIARRYGRARVTVIQYITQLKFRIQHQREDIETYDKLKKRGF